MSSSAEMAAPANIRVLVRVRPFSDRETRSSHLEIDDGGMTTAIDFGMGDVVGASSSTTTATSSNSTTIHGGLNKESKGTIYLVDQSAGSGGYGSGYDSGTNNYAASAASRSFTYDAVFGPQSKQLQIFDSIKGIVDAVCAGYNGTIVAYGQTGSGKTYTIFGEEGLQDDENAGLVQRSLKSIFDKIEEQSVAAENGVGIRTTTTTKASFFEIYNERVYDLLSPNEHMTDDDKGLLVREDATKGVYVEGLAEVEVSDTTEAMDVLRSGLDNRRVASTKMNRVSSRSHALFVLTVRSELFSENGISKVRMSKFTLVDLAGSERQKTTAADGDRLKEACNINNSLLCLGQVINALVDREKGKLNHVAFRNTNLTFLLRDSFGGNSKTCLVATVSPSHASLTETMSTLKFAQRAKLIKNTAVLNENTCGSVADLQSEIARLKAELELKHASIQPVESGDHSMNGIGLPPLAPRSNADAAGKPSNSTIVSALRNQNSMLSKKVKDLRDVSNQREMQVNSLKRKVQQETMIRKCKERRITYLSNKGGTNGIDDSDEVVALREEVAVLQEQVQAQPQHDPIEWMLKYKEEKAKVDEMEANAAITFEPNEKTDMEASLVMLLDERDSLQQKVKEMSNERNVEIDAIINDVTTLENSNVKLQSQLDEKEATIMAHEKTIQSDAAHIDELQVEMKVTLDRLEMTQKELEVEMQKTIELQASVDKMKIEVRDANEAVAEHKGKVEVAQKELVTTKEMHEESLTALNAELLNLRTNLNDAMAENELLLNKVKDVSEDLESKMVELGNLEAAKNEALQQLELGKSKNDADMESFKCREEELMAEFEGLKASFDSILAEKSQAFDTISAQNASLLGEVEELKMTSESLQRRIASTQDTVAALEDEIVLVNIENEQASERHNFVKADLERTIRLQDHSRETQLHALRHELAINEEIIHCLSREKEFTEKDLRSNLNGAIAENELLINKLKDVSECLESKVVELGNLEAAKNEALQQLELGKSKSDANIESLKLREEELMAEFEGMKAHFDSILAEKSHEFVIVNAQNASLQGEFEELKTTSEYLQRRIASTQDIVAALEDEIVLINIENAQASNEHIFVQADLERTIRLQDHLRETQFDALSNELAINEEINHCLSRGKTSMQNDLDIVSKQLSDKTDEFDGKVASLENDISALRENISMLKAEKEEAAALQKEHALTVLQLTSQNDSLSASVEALKTEFDDRQQLSRAKIIELETTLSEVSCSNDNLNKLLAEVSKDLDGKNTQLQATEEARNEGVQQRSQCQEQHNAAIESFRLRELSLTEDITKANETIASLLADKAATAVDLENAMLHGTSLANEVEEAKSLAASLEKQCAALSSIDAEVARVTAEKVELEDRVKASEAKVDQMADALIAAQIHGEQFAMLKMEKEEIQNELEDLKKRFSEKELAMGGQIEMFESEVAILKENRQTMELNGKELQSKLDSLKEENSSLAAQIAIASDNIDSANELSRIEYAKSQAECERLNEELRSKTDRTDELEALLGNVNALCKELSEQNAVMSSKVEALQADQKSKEEDVVGVANEQCIEMPTSENPPDWEASPIKHTSNPIQDTTFSADDTFDESMFLPNVHDDLKSPQTDENKTPPTPITSNKRVLFSPSGKESANVKAAAKSATPVQRLTRSMRNKARTPLGKSAVQNASSTTRKSRAKRQKSDD